MFGATDFFYIHTTNTMSRLAFAFFIVIPLFSVAQSPRLILVEQFNNVNCDSCAAANTQLSGFEAANSGKLINLRYHVSWPGEDPFNAATINQVEQRRSWYGVSGIPTAIMDGNVYNDDPTLAPIAQTDIGDRYAIDSPFNITLNHQISLDFDSVYVEFIIEATLPITAGMKAHAIVSEDTIALGSAPGTNGETTFNHIARSFLSGNGEVISGSWIVGQRDTLNYMWLIEDVYRLNHIEVIGFIQDTLTKEIHQTAVSVPLALSAVTINDAYLVRTTNIDSIECDSTVYPEIVIQNNGSAPLTSVDIMYSVNGGTDSTYSWTGNLNFLEQETVMLGGYSYLPGSPNTLSLNTTNPNLSPDDNTTNDSFMVQYNSAATSHPTLLFELHTDDYGQEISWVITNNNGTIVAADTTHNYGDNQEYNEVINLPASDCYEFTIMDQFGDGICCATDSGYYVLRDNNGMILLQGSTFNFSESISFYVDFLLSSNQIAPNESELSVYPNPFNERFSIRYENPITVRTHIQLYDVFGRLIESVNNINFQTSTIFEMNISDLPAGNYLLKVIDGNKIMSHIIVSY